jgi:hypothetical protein
MWLLPGGLDAHPGKDGSCFFVLQERLYSPLSIARFSGSASGFVHFHVNRSPLFLIAETVGQLVLLGDPRPDGRAARFRRGAKQRLAEFHHLSLEAFRRWPRAGVWKWCSLT